MINLRKIDRTNWQEAINLPTGEDHKKFVASNLYSIAQGQFYEGQTSYGIYLGERMIGYVLCGDNRGFDVFKGLAFWLCRMMIAEGERHKGYGKLAMQQIFQLARDNNFFTVFLSTKPENEMGIRFYQSLGFKFSGEMLDDEQIMVINLAKS